jgi:hypothetical protein
MNALLDFVVRIHENRDVKILRCIKYAPSTFSNILFCWKADGWAIVTSLTTTILSSLQQWLQRPPRHLEMELKIQNGVVVGKRIPFAVLR